MIGTLTAYVMFALSLAATYLYFIAFRNEGNESEASKKTLERAGILHWVVSFGVVFISVYLLSLIMDHNFSYTYVYNYSSTELPTGLLISSFYAGQEGSFTLWCLLFVIVGFFLRPYAKKHGYESIVMAIYFLIISFLLLMIILKSPFEQIWNTYKDHQLEKGFMPQNGKGMNPILQNYWMVIHPPILFIGYTMMSVPFVFALGGLIKKDFNNWFRIATPWTLVGTAILGLGIMLGGFWAYETLGWGGFWGWDPVENSSLLPWMVAVSLVHTLIVQRKTGGLLKTNFVLAVLTFVLVIYATFLTRSGVLSDTSVHSFTKPGNMVYALLLIFQIVFTLGPIILLVVRLKSFPKRENSMKFSSKEAFLTIGSIVMLASALIIFFGTSFPLISAILGTKQGSPQTKFYNDSNLPIIILILITNAMSLFMTWRSTDWNALFKKIMIALVASLVFMVLSFVFVTHDFRFNILIFGSFFTLIINLELTLKHVAKNPRGIGAFLSHLGLAIMMFGILGSGVFSTTQNVHLALNETQEVMGYKVTFTGANQIEKEYKDREKFQYLIRVEKDGSAEYIKPIIYLSDFNERQDPFFEPGIKTYATKDIYLSPKGIEREFDGEFLKLRKTETGNVTLDTNMKMQFLGFDMQHSQQSNENSLMLGAAVKVTRNGKEFDDTLYASLNMQTSEFVPTMKEIAGSGIYAGFSQLLRSQENIAMSQAMIVFSKTPEVPKSVAKEVITFEMAIKPIINLVWLGVILVVGGFFLSAFKVKKPVVAPETQTDDMPVAETEEEIEKSDEVEKSDEDENQPA